MIINSKKILKEAFNNGYAIPHFNINNLEWTRYILEECQNNNSPVIIGVSESAVRYIGGYDVVSGIVATLVKDLNITIPVVIHLDHGSSFESCKSAIDAGFSSVMIDASKHDLDENIRITKEVVNYAKEYNVSVEAELGHISADGIANEECFAKVDECIRFVQETGVDSIAPALGSVHGLYKGEPHLNYERMKEIKESVNIPLVLHGGTGIPDDDIKKAISCGISKLNINTELQVAWSTSVKEFIENNKDIYDPRKIIGSGEANMKKSIKDKIILVDSCNKI